MLRFLIWIGLGAVGLALAPGLAWPAKTETATFAGGCFWCMEPPYKDLPGVLKVTVGYTGGHVPNPTYEQVSSGTTGHREAVEINFDPGRITYAQLLDVFWRQIDPTDAGGQFADQGSQYRTAVFFHSEEQERAAEASKAALAKSGRFAGPIRTEILPATAFYPAEDYHQEYSLKNPLRYKLYKLGSGRETFQERVWGDKSKAPSSQAPGERKP